MKRGHGVNERYSENPVGSDDPRGKNRERRKHKLDGPTLTPTEAHIRNNLMRQFMRNPEGTAGQDESAYKSASCWCECGKGLKDENGLCGRCDASAKQIFREYCAQAPRDADGYVSGNEWLKFAGQRMGLWDNNGSPIE